MLRGIFSLDNPLMRFLSRVADIMVLNILFIVCSIPVFTIGASWSALYYCLFKIKDEEEGYLVRKFFHSFKQNIKQATIMWLIMFAIGALLFVEFIMYRNVEGMMGNTVRAIVIVGWIFWYLIGTYAFALQSRFYNSIGNTFRNAVLLLFANGPRSIAIIGLTAAIIAFTMMQKNTVVLWNLILIWFLFGFAAVATINVQLLYPVIRKLMPEEAKEETATDSAFTVDEQADLSTLGYGPAEKADVSEVAAEKTDAPELSAEKTDAPAVTAESAGSIAQAEADAKDAENTSL